MSSRFEEPNPEDVEIVSAIQFLNDMRHTVLNLTETIKSAIILIVT